MSTEQSRSLVRAAMLSTSASRAKCKDFQRTYARQRELVRACEGLVEETWLLLDRLNADRARRLPHARGPLDWLRIDEFERLTPAQKEVYLRRLADRLSHELQPCAAVA